MTLRQRVIALGEEMLNAAKDPSLDELDPKVLITQHWRRKLIECTAESEVEMTITKDEAQFLMDNLTLYTSNEQKLKAIEILEKLGAER